MKIRKSDGPTDRQTDTRMNYRMPMVHRAPRHNNIKTRLEISCVGSLAMDSSPAISPIFLGKVNFKEIDWFSIPKDQRIVSDEILDMITDSSGVIMDLQEKREQEAPT